MKILSFFLFISLSVFSILPMDHTSANSTVTKAFSDLNQNDRFWIYHGSGDPLKCNRNRYKKENALKTLRKILAEDPTTKWVLSQHPFCFTYLLILNTDNPNDIEKLDLNAIMKQRS